MTIFHRETDVVKETSRISTGSAILRYKYKVSHRHNQLLQGRESIGSWFEGILDQEADRLIVTHLGKCKD